MAETDDECHDVTRQEEKMESLDLPRKKRRRLAESEDDTVESETIENWEERAEREEDREEECEVEGSSTKLENPTLANTQEDLENDHEFRSVSKKKNHRAATTSQRPPKSVPLEEPEAYLFPVVLEDLKTGSAHFEALCPFTQSAFDTIGLKPIRRQRRLLSGKWLIDARDERDQKKLAQATALGQIHVRCFIPKAITHGVIRPFPLSQDIKWIKGSHDAICNVQRLKFCDKNEKDRNKRFKDSKAVKVSFQLADLPKTLVVGSEIFTVLPYVDSVRRCAKCQKFDHHTDQCRTRVRLCARCGKEAHGDQPCSGPLHCVNCQGQHSAAWQECPTFQLRRRAHEIKATTSVPIALALRKAREEAGELSPKAPTYKHEHFYRPPEEAATTPPATSTPKSAPYANAVKTGRALLPPPTHVSVREGKMTVLGKPGPRKAPATQPLPQRDRRDCSQVPFDERAVGDISSTDTDSERTKASDLRQKNEAPNVQSTDIATAVEKAVAQIMQTFFSQMDARLKALESQPVSVAPENIVESVMDKMHSQRKARAAELSRRVRAMEEKKEDPVTVMVGRLMEGIVDATLNNKPGPLLTLVTNLYNKAHGGDSKAAVPKWDGRLQTLGDLALGLY